MTGMTTDADLRELTVGTGAGGEQLGTDMVLNIGPQHPSTHGVLRLRLVLDGERVVAAEPIVGYMHRGAEKLFEVRDYRQVVVLANRHDWLSAFSNELGVVLAVERLMGMEVPERATWLRMALAELNRVLNHLMFLGSYPLEIGAITPMFYAFRERETIQAVMEEVSGGRIHYMFNRVGGLKEEVPAGWTGRARAAVGEVRRRMPDLDNLIRRNEIFLARTVGVGVLSAADAAAYGASGPVARASGLDLDLRRDEPYLAYDQLDVPVVTRTAGDCHARFEVLLDQVYASLDLAEQCLDRVDQLTGPVNNGYYLVSRGEKTPWRLKLRTASYANVQALATLLPGCLVPDLIAILGSMFFVVGDIDK
jgi:NADH-quinone oxidoreductase subunit D